MATATGDKAPGAFKTIGELSRELGVAQHILRYWETRFPQLRPLQRAGNRRYYRPADVELARRIHRLLSAEGYTVRGVQKMLRDKSGEPASPTHAAIVTQSVEPESSPATASPPAVDLDRLRDLRNFLADSLDG
ncbi:MAG TPA: MerR family transcriptional regulator [Sphingomicrobium sp.]|nr:MerR family transcriptional regulator [Sphingomicrobium sp.]